MNYDWTAAQREESTQQEELIRWENPILKHRFKGHEETILCFVFLHDNVHIVSGSVDGTVRKWNCDTGLLVEEPWKDDGGGIYALALSPDGKMIVCGRKDGGVQRWTTDGEMIEGVWTGHSKTVWSLSWSSSGSQIASGSEDRTILIRNAESGEVEVGPIDAKQGWLWSLAYSPSGERIASGGDKKTICIWDTKTGELIVGPIQDMGNSVTSLVWSSDSTKLYSASDEFPRVFNSETGELLHRFEHGHIDASDEFARVFSSNNASDVRAFNSRCTSDEHRTPRLGHSFDRFRTARFGDPPPSGHSFAIYPYDRPKVYHHNILNSVALSPTHDILACVGANGVAQFWDTVSHQQLGQPLHKNHKFTLRCVSFSRDGRYVAYGGYDKKLTLRMLKDIAPQLLPNRRQSTQQVTRPNSPLSSCLDADATGGGGFIEEARDDPYYHFFQQPPPSPSPGFRLPLLFSTRRLWNVISRRCPPPDESVPQECSKRGFFSRRARSNLSQEVATIKPDQQVLESKREEGDGEQRETVDDCGFTHDSPSARKDEGKQRDDPPDNAQSPPSADRTPPAQPDSKDSRCLRERLIHAQGKYLAFGFLRSSTPSANAPKQILRNHRYWNSSSYPLGSSRYTVDVAACRDEDRYGIAPETDEEAAAAMLRTNNDVADSSTRPGQPVVVAQVSQGQLTQTQASTSGPGEIVYEGVSCCGFFCGYVRRSNPHVDEQYYTCPELSMVPCESLHS